MNELQPQVQPTARPPHDNKVWSLLISLFFSPLSFFAPLSSQGIAPGGQQGV